VAHGAATVDLFSEMTTTSFADLIAVLPEYAYRGDGPSFYISTVGRAVAMERLGQAGGGTNVLTIQNGLATTYSGWPIVITQKMPRVTTALNNLSMVLFGNMRQGVAFGDRRSITIDVLRERYAEFLEVGFLGHERVDINFHEEGDATNAGAVVSIVGTT
jgi:HK97 family phage major capsid protein